ncbi:phosphohistidine phosphatase [Pontibacter qinzhouensis]|uniref:Phosphohistidine phosphatase n=1 Tax=Pontibacter qinzhouensis TaxID=2603253 RepID=A0A5C8K6V3_9BACT|nr:histidine phosphatase family protein [Pontibacter qinzhouensis]TXK47921.1 phosphohistidine phosphatase [Pontibacter qinzhouensis]
MQRQVLICRHAEAIDHFSLQPDFGRELTKAGMLQAHQTGQWIRDNFSKVDVIVTSPANRASATARILASKLYYDDQHILYVPELYNAGEPKLLQAISTLPDKDKTLLLVGHNPGITQLARHLLDKHITYLEPANVLAISLELEKWEDIYASHGLLLSHNMQHIY